MKTRHLTVLIAVAGALVLVGIQLAFIEQWLALHDARDRQSHIRQEMFRLARLVNEVDHGVREYAFLKQPAFLRSIKDAEGAIPAVIDRLNQLTESRPDLEGHLRIVNDRVTQLLDTKRRLSKQIQSGQAEDALEYMRGQEGLALTNTTALAFQALEQKLEQQQQEWDRQTASALQWLRWGVPVTVMGGVVCGLGIGRMTGRSHVPLGGAASLGLRQTGRQSQVVPPHTLV